MLDEVLSDEPYKVLARKWRPSGFDDLAGQDTAVKILKNAISQNRIAHAYIFSGPRGVGKTSAARVFAKALNCVEGPTPSPCGDCPNCVAIGNGSFLDVVEIDGASNNSVADVRELREKVKYAPSGAKYKIYIIDEAHMLSNAAFNALLKTLEEPPAHVVFILATTEPKKIIATVLSRCQHLPFKRISLDTIGHRLRVVSEGSGFNVSDGAIAAIAKAADGSMRDSLTLLDQIASFSAGEQGINEDDVAALIGITNTSAISATALSLTTGNRKEIIGQIAALYESGVDILSFTRDLIEYFRDALVEACASKGGRGDSATSLDISEEGLTVILSELLKAEGVVKNAESPRTALEMCLIKISFLSSLKTIGDIIQDIEAGTSASKPLPPGKQGMTASEPELKLTTVAPVQEQKTEKPASPNDVSTEPQALLSNLWNGVLDRIYDVSAPLWGILKDAAVTVEDAAVHIVLSGGNVIHADSVMEKKSIVEAVFHELTGNKYSVTVKTAKLEKSKEKNLRAEALSDPVVKDVLDLFGGAVVEVRPAAKK